MADPVWVARARDKDLLGRRALAQALADKLYDHATGPRDADPGPTVVTIEGPWGSGKSTLLDLVRRRH
jgi:polynucleotide 5'-kinase involved in rRNA processing